MIFRKIVRESGKHDKGDAEFDSYILAPEHKDKKDVLKAMDILVEYRLLGEDEK